MPQLDTSAKNSSFDTHCENEVYAWQIEDALKEKKGDLGVKEVYRRSVSEVSQSFGGKEETVEFDLVLQSDGSTIKCNVRIKPGDGDDDGSKKGSGLSFGIDTSKIKNKEQAKEAFDKFNASVIQCLLKTKPAGSEITLFSHGNNRWDDIAQASMREMVLKNEAAFRERGILSFSMNGEMILDLRPEQDQENAASSDRKVKPWDVPKGAPKPPGSASNS